MADMHTPLPDYTAMTSGDMLSALRDDASKWAAAFCQTAEKLGIPDIDEGWMIGWFANAIEQSSAVRDFARSSQDAETIKALREALTKQRAWVRHWLEDVRGNLKPTQSSLERQLERLSASLSASQKEPSHV